MNTALILEQLTLVENSLAIIRAEVTPPPPPVPPAPSLAVATHYGEVTFEFAAAAFDGGAFSMQFRAHESDTTGHGPQEWTDLITTGTPNMTVPNAANRILELRAWCEREGVRSEYVTLVLMLNDYLPTPPVEE